MRGRLAVSLVKYQQYCLRGRVIIWDANLFLLSCMFFSVAILPPVLQLPRLCPCCSSMSCITQVSSQRQAELSEAGLAQTLVGGRKRNEAVLQVERSGVFGVLSVPW